MSKWFEGVKQPLSTFFNFYFLLFTFYFLLFYGLQALEYHHRYQHQY